MRLPALALAIALCAGCSAATSPANQSEAAGRAQSEPADARTRAIVKSAEVFLATLTVQQKAAALFDWSDDRQRRNWSNFPEPFAGRKGVKWGDLDAKQRTALLELLGSVLSDEGVAMVRLQMASDDANAVLDRERKAAGQDRPPGPPPAGSAGGLPPGAPPAGAPGRPRAPAAFGADNYFVSFVGAPSASSPWMLQFGGHHLAINATIVGPNVTLSPTLTGGEPLRFTDNGRPVHLTANEIDAAQALMAALSPAQRAQAVVSSQRDHLQLGPGTDGKTLPAEGIRGDALNPKLKKALLALIEARLGILNRDDLAQLMRTIAANLDQTSLGWWGPVTPGQAAYWRIVGPTIILEYSPEDLDGDAAEHAHNIYRDPTNEYGAGWTALK